MVQSVYVPMKKYAPVITSSLMPQAILALNTMISMRAVSARNSSREISIISQTYVLEK